MFTKSLITLFSLTILLFNSCSRNSLPIISYYNYDRELPLNDSIYQLPYTSGKRIFYTSFKSIHNQKVTGLLTIPQKGSTPFPVIILMHGLGDKKTVDYIEAGHNYLLNAGYAVLRLDIYNHGDRKTEDHKFALTGAFRYWSRDVISQTIFDLRRAVDFIETQEELDHKQIGYFGISLGGIIGTTFCGIEERIKVPVIVLAGGGLNLLYGTKAISPDTKNYLSIFDPINFVARISPRPLLMINAENDDIVPRITSKLLYNKAKSPKHIKWYQAKHHTIPIDSVFLDGIDWFNRYLN